MAYEISEALYAGASVLPLSSIEHYKNNPLEFTSLYEDVIDALRGPQVLGSETNTKSDQLKSGFLDAIKDKSENTLFNDLAGAVSAVSATRKATGLGKTPIVYLTGNQWHNDIKDFKVPAAGMDDYNSSDIVLNYGKLYIGISLKKKRRMMDASPPLTNAAFSGFLKSDAVRQLQERVEEIRYKFFANLIWKACQETGRASPFWSDIAEKDLLECGEAGPAQMTRVPTGEVDKKGKPITEKYEYRLPDLNVDPKTGPNLEQAKKIMNMKVDVWRWSKPAKGKTSSPWTKASVPLINLKDVGHVRNLNPTMKGLPAEKNKIISGWRDYVNGQLKGDSGTLWKDFVDVLNGKDKDGKDIMVDGKPFSTYMADTLLTRALKLDLKKVLGDRAPEFDFYLVEGVGRVSKKMQYVKGDKKTGQPIKGEITLTKSEAARIDKKTQEYTSKVSGVEYEKFVDEDGFENYVFVPDMGNASVVEAETLLEKISKWCNPTCQNWIELQKGSAEAASAEFILYMKSSDPSKKVMKALDITLRYSGSFVSHPRFHATMTSKFKNEFKTN